VRVAGGVDDFVLGRDVADRDGADRDGGAAADDFAGEMGFGSAADTGRAGADRGTAAVGGVGGDGCSGGSTDKYSPQRGQCSVIVVVASRTRSFDRQPGHSTI
jgi:hypothetical protein